MILFVIGSVRSGIFNGCRRFCFCIRCCFSTCCCCFGRRCFVSIALVVVFGQTSAYSMSPSLEFCLVIHMGWYSMIDRFWVVCFCDLRRFNCDGDTVKKCEGYKSERRTSSSASLVRRDWGQVRSLYVTLHLDFFNFVPQH